MCTTAHINAIKAIGSPYVIRLSVLVDHVACLFVSVRHVKPYIYPIWGEKVACAAVSRHLYVLPHIKMQWRYRISRCDLALTSYRSCRVLVC